MKQRQNEELRTIMKDNVDENQTISDTGRSETEQKARNKIG